MGTECCLKIGTGDFCSLDAEGDPDMWIASISLHLRSEAVNIVPLCSSYKGMREVRASLLRMS